MGRSIATIGVPGLLDGGGDTVAPTCVLTTAASDAVAAAFSITITFSEDVTGFAVGDITVGNGAAGTFVTVSGSVYTAVITPADIGAMSVQVGAGVCTDLAGNANTASNTLAPFSLLGAGVWVDAANAASLFQDSAGTTPAVADGDVVGRAGRVASNLATQATTGNKPVLKLNIQNGKPVIRFDADDVLDLANLNLLKNIGSTTLIAVARYPNATTSHYAVYYSTGAAAAALRTGLAARISAGTEYGTGGRRLDEDSFRGVTGGTVSNVMVIHSAQLDYTNSNADAYINGSSIASTTSFQADGATSNTASVYAAVGASASSGTASLAGDLAELMIFVPALTTLQRQAVESYLNAKWAVYA